MTPIEILLSIGLRDIQIAMRLQVTKQTVSYWRAKRVTPTTRHQLAAKAYIDELREKLLPCSQPI